MVLDENSNIGHEKIERETMKEKKIKKVRLVERASTKDKKIKSDDTKKLKSRAEQSADEDDIWSYQPKEILAASDLYDGEIKFRIQFKRLKRKPIVSAKVANIMCPNLVIDFYEKHLVFRK